MALQLTVPIDVGDLDSNDYTHVRIIRFALDVMARTIQFQTVEGYIQNGQFVRGRHGRERGWEIQDIPVQGVEGEPGYVAADPAFTILAGTQGEDGQRLYDGVANTLYQWLIDHGHYAGIIT